jgi:hypothetical protein
MKRSGWAYDTFFDLIVAFAMSSAAATASAGELFVMPYSCSVVGGQPMLTPSNDHGYTVIGRPEHREFSACSEMNPGLCKKWKVYRFDLDCDGTRVPWSSIAAAVSAGRNGRAWLEAGRLHIEMPARWNMTPDDPCAQPFSDENWWRPGGFSRMCADRQTQGRGGPIIEMPDGYAPMMGLDGIFVADAAPKVDPAPPPLAARKLSPAKAVHPAPPKPATVAIENSTARQAGQQNEAEPPKKDVVSPPNDSAQPKKDVRAQPTLPATALSSHLDHAPKIINQPNPSQNNAGANASGAVPAAAPNPPIPSAASEMSSIPASTIGSAKAPESQAPQRAETITGSLQSASLSAITDPVDTGVLAAVSLAAFSLVAITFYQWRERARLSLAGSRDLASLSLDGRATGRDITIAPVNMALWQSLDNQDPRSQDTRIGPVVSNDIPQTREQALQILGMGVTPDVGEVAIKKIVDGLRLSWHPDHAKSIEERQLREFRMKQINAAWDIISGKRFA